MNSSKGSWDLSNTSVSLTSASVFADPLTARGFSLINRSTSERLVGMDIVFWTGLEEAPTCFLGSWFEPALEEADCSGAKLFFLHPLAPPPPRKEPGEVWPASSKPTQHEAFGSCCSYNGCLYNCRRSGQKGGKKAVPCRIVRRTVPWHSQTLVAAPR